MAFPRPRVLWTFSFALLFIGYSLSNPAFAQIRPEQARAMNQQSYASSVILQGGNHAQTMQRLHVVRQYALQNLRSNPRVMLGEAQLDFTPLLNNAKALPNVAIRLQALPQHVQVQANTSDVTEVDQGLVIHHLLTYQILPGKCADAGAKAQLAAAGVSCFSRSTTAQRVSEFSVPGSPRYIADPRKRQAAIAEFQQKSAAADADASQHIAALRKSLADPTQRAAIVAKVGQAEAARMSSLSDDDLKDELVNMSVQTVEETMFVPRLESSNYAHPQHPLAPDASPAEIAATQQLMRNGVSGGASPAGFPQAAQNGSGFRASSERFRPAARRSDGRSQHGPVLLSHRLHHRPRL
jgi:hypothetical protein